MTKAQFIAHFLPIYPDADLSAYADELGLISEPVGAEPPATIPASGEGDGKEPDVIPAKNTATSSKTSKPKGGSI
jgi:hypothetical protein